MAVDPKLFETLLALPSQIDALSAEVRASNDVLKVEVERFRALVGALNPALAVAPAPSPMPYVPRAELTAKEQAQRDTLLQQFRTTKRAEIEADMENGA